jgi:glycosyltransferase involved in cell wall biosynthesis
MRNTKAKVSVLVAVYNTEKYLYQCLDSLTNQSLKEIQIVCIDDGSSDGSNLILAKYAQKDSRILLLSQENKGASAARNLGITKAVGEYICLVDSDDYLDHDCLKISYEKAIENNLDSVVFKMDFFGSTTSFNNRFQDEIFSGKEATLLSVQGLISGVGLFRSSIVESIGYDSKTMNGDELSTRKFFLAAKRVGFSYGRYYYRQHDESTTKKFSIKIFDTLKTDAMLRDLLRKVHLYEESKKQFETIAFFSFIDRELLFLDNKEKLSNLEARTIRVDLEKSFSMFDRAYLRRTIIRGPFLRRALFFMAVRLQSYKKLESVFGSLVIFKKFIAKK